MNLEQRKYRPDFGWDMESNPALSRKAQLVLAFCPVQLLERVNLLELLKSGYPQAHAVCCSGHGEIANSQAYDDCIVVTAIEFERTRILGASIHIDQMTESFQAGEKLAGSIPASIPGEDGCRENLVHVMVFSDGLHVNGSELIKGMIRILPDHVTITGGLAGDALAFRQTFVSWDEEPSQNRIAIVGFYGSRIRIGYGSIGGWDPFGPERLVTKAGENILYEFDGKSALTLYKKYLGKYADDLPASGYFFPLSFRGKNSEQGVVRTIFSVDEKEQSMIFAGDIPEGSYSRMMRTNIEKLIEGAAEAAKIGVQAISPCKPRLAILVSCAGRRNVLRQRFEEELESVQEVLGENVISTGFYSFGELAPFRPGAKCELHNQTMTVTIIGEDTEENG